MVNHAEPGYDAQPSCSRGSNASVRAVALPTLTASLRILRIRSSGANGCPLTIPTEASSPRISGFAASTGSVCTTSLIRSQYESSTGGIVLNDVWVASTKRVGADSVAGANGLAPERYDETGDPTVPGWYG